MKNRLITFFKKETVLSIAIILAVLSAFLVTPDKGYLEYVDYRTIAILFCLMAVMTGYSKIGVFTKLAKYLIGHVKGMRGLLCILIFLCFFFSMLITNDVALITFVPLSIIVLKLLGSEYMQKWMIPVVVMQTIAANLGSMLTPIGNPQNLYLYERAGSDLVSFILLMLPYSGLACGMLLLWIMVKCGKKSDRINVELEKDETVIKKRKLFLYTVLFVLCLFTVAKRIPYPCTLGIVIAGILVADRKILKQVDYSLLLTFVGFFVFIGNMGRVSAFQDLLMSVIHGKEVVTAVVCSQVMSNVPAALLLSGFTTEYEKLIIGTNLGGLGTLIASMASLISFKYVAREDKALRGPYFRYFTVVNFIFLFFMLMLYVILVKVG